MMGLTREQILEAKDLNMQEVPVTEWSGTVFIRAMTGTDLEEWQDFNYRRMNAGNGNEPEITGVRIFLLLRTLAGDDGELLFGPTDEGPLREKCGKALDFLFDKAMAWNKLLPDDAKELEENSDGAPTSSTGSS